ncbi:DUF362 domain-containing protein [Coraliomargarita sinensis]|nr:DUF362 domain-containing protein [Coraliomargarita sinensis]
MAENFVQCVHRRIHNEVEVSLSRQVYGCQVDRLRHGLSYVILMLCAVSMVGAADLVKKAPLGLVWEAPLAYQTDYYTEVEALLSAYETSQGEQLVPGERGRVGLKVNTRGGAGLSTPPELLRAMIASLESRGFGRNDIYIVDYSAHSLRSAGIMPSLSSPNKRFNGVRVLALDSEKYYDPEWFYDSPLPAAYQQEPRLMLEGRNRDSLKEGDEARKSFLPEPLLFEVDFWINFAVGVDDPALGVDGALASATLWNVSNSRRFLVNQATASAAVAEIAAIPELAERLVLNFVSLEAYQFIGGPFFNAIYTRSEPRLWMSSDPVALDRLLYDRINHMRRLEGFPEIDPLPRQLPFATSLGLGVHERSSIQINKLELTHPEKERPRETREPPKFEQAPDWLKKITPW